MLKIRERGKVSLGSHFGASYIPFLAFVRFAKAKVYFHLERECRDLQTRLCCAGKERWHGSYPAYSTRTTTRKSPPVACGFVRWQDVNGCASSMTPPFTAITIVMLLLHRANAIDSYLSPLLYPPNGT